nr:hypothetical protein [Tanacetum cinerariifolium]
MTGEMSRGTSRDNIGSTPVGINGSTSGGPLEINVKTPRTETTPSAREQIEGHLSALGSLLKEHNRMGNVSPIHLSFDDVEDRTRVQTVVTGAEIGDADLKSLSRRRSKEAFASTEQHKRETAGPVSRREDKFQKGGYGVGRRRNEERNTFNNRDRLIPYRAQISYQAPRDQGFHHPRLNLNSLTKLSKEILASEPQLNLQPPRPMQLPLKKENHDKYCDYHREKGHYTNDCFQPRRQLEMALELGKLNHLIKDDGPKIPPSGFFDNTPHGKVPHPKGVTTLVTRSAIIFECQRLERKQMAKSEANQNINQEKGVSERVDMTEQTLVNPAYLVQLVTIGENLLEQCKNHLKILLKKSMDVFEWEPTDMTGMPRRVIEHSLNVNPSVEPVAQKGWVMASDRLQVMSKEVEEWVSVRIVHPVRYPTWISNPMLVKSDGNAYKGYHQVQMAQDDEEKTASYTDQGTYCYTKMPFRLKNAGATYQRVVDTAFQSQIRRNLEAYVDDMVIKSNDEKVLIEDIAEKFDNLRRINMKLNLKKCSFGVEEGKFMGYMVTSKGIRANLKKTKAIVDMQSPRTLKEMQSLTGKLAALKRFLSCAEKAFQEMKKVIVDLPLLTIPVKEETIYVYVATAMKAVSDVLLAERKRIQCLIHYVRRALNEDEMSYAPLEKLALSLLHMFRRLRRYFEAYPIKAIMNQPLKQILNKAQASGKLAKYLVELRAYNIAYEPIIAMKGQF